MIVYVGFAAAAAGIASHLFYFNHGEHHMYAVRYIQSFFAVFAIAMLYGVVYCHQDAGEVLSYMLPFTACYLGGLYTSLLCYRIFFSPSNSFPGPFGAKISKFWFSTQLTRHDAFKKIHELHQKYGDFVRIGPSELSIVHPKAVQAIYGFGSKCRKTAWYDLLLPIISLETIRDRTIHDARRRIWAPAFKEKAIREYKDRLIPHQERLIKQIHANSGMAINISKLFMLYGFDVMADLAFEESFGMLQSNEYHWAVKLLQEGLKPLGFILPEWFFRIMSVIPGLADDWFKFIGYTKERLYERMKVEKAATDIMSVLLEPYKDKKPTARDMIYLEGDCFNIVVAGSDTTAGALTHIIYELISNPTCLETLRIELGPYLAPSVKLPPYEDLSKLEQLDSVIYETLRLHPTLPTYLPRITPPEGLQIGDTFVPGDTIVTCPPYVMGRNESAYVHAESFIPSRWTSQPSLVKERSAFAPFSTGPNSCIGRPLAMLNLRTTLLRLLQTFDFGFAPGEDGRGVREETREHFTVEVGRCEVVFLERGKGMESEREN